MEDKMNDKKWSEQAEPEQVNSEDISEEEEIQPVKKTYKKRDKFVKKDVSSTIKATAILLAALNEHEFRQVLSYIKTFKNTNFFLTLGNGVDFISNQSKIIKAQIEEGAEKNQAYKKNSQKK
jgi:hypothetical protein